MFGNIFNQNFKNIVSQIQGPLTNNEEQGDSPVEASLNELEILLEGFAITNEDEDYINKLRSEYQKFNSAKESNNEKAYKQVAENEVNEAISILNDEQAEVKEPEFDNRTVQEFVTNFISSNINSLDNLFYEIEDSLSDGLKYVVTRDESYSSKGQKKSKGALKSYAHYSKGDAECMDSVHNLLVLFDMTLFGSGSDGITFAGHYITFKSMSHDREFIYLDDINSISVRASDKELKVNSSYFEYFHSEITRPLKKTVDCFNTYLNQPGVRLRKHLATKV